MSCMSDTAVIVPLAPVSPPEDTGGLSPSPHYPGPSDLSVWGSSFLSPRLREKGFFIRNQGRQEARLWKGHPNGNQAKNSDALLELLHGENCSSGFYGEMAQL